MKKTPTTKNNPEPKVVFNWRPTGQVTPLWSRLWEKLLVASRKEKPTGTREAASDKKYEDENDKTIEGD